MGIMPDQRDTQRTPLPSRARRAMTGGAYGVIFVLGLVEGMIGSFQYSRGPAPAASIIFCVLILATCLLTGWALRSIGGAFVPALGWIVASFVLSLPNSEGSVIIANTTAGKWYLYGGTLCAAAGVAGAFVLWIRSQRPS
jgi:hypothetical protein